MPDGRYSLLFDLPPPPDPIAFLPCYFWIALPIAPISWVLARRLVKPVLELRQTVREFGSGTLTRRARFRRHGEIGDLARDFDAMADRLETLLTVE